MDVIVLMEMFDERGILTLHRHVASLDASKVKRHDGVTWASRYLRAGFDRGRIAHRPVLRVGFLTRRSPGASFRGADNRVHVAIVLHMPLPPLYWLDVGGKDFVGLPPAQNQLDDRVVDFP